MRARAAQMSWRLAAAAVLGVVLAVIASSAPSVDSGRGDTVGRRDREPAAPVVTTLHHRHDGGCSGNGSAGFDAEAWTPDFALRVSVADAPVVRGNFVWSTLASARGPYRGPAPPVAS